MPIVLPSPTQNNKCLTADEFFAVVDDILVEAGRQALDPMGPQRRIVEVRSSDRVLQILAGPGSGKTEMLVLRVLFDLFVNGADPNRLIVTTFTRRAASELVIRIVERAEAIQTRCVSLGIKVRDPQVHNLRIGTTHSLCEQILTEFDSDYRDAGRSMIDQAETYARMLRSLYRLGRYQGTGTVDRLMNRDAFRALFTPPWEPNSNLLSTMGLVDVLTAMISQHVETWVPRCGADDVPNGAETVHGMTGLTDDLKTVTARWQEELAQAQVVDFATIQQLFHDRQDVFLDHFDHVFVDEFQDSNPMQFALHTRWLERLSTRLTVVADDDQSLYRFRGSDIECLVGLEPHCKDNDVAFRAEILDVNYRSTKNIVNFAQKFRQETVLSSVGLPKSIIPAADATPGEAVRLLEGNWSAVCDAVADDLAARDVGRPGAGQTAAVIMFSTRESDSTKRGPSPALQLRRALEAKGLRVFNLSSKTASDKHSPVSELLGLLSYLIDPITKAMPPGAARPSEVWASNSKPHFAAEAFSAPPTFAVSGHHIDCQKAFLKKDNGKIGAPTGDRARLTQYLDKIRAELVKASGSARLTMSGLISRILADPYFRASGFTPNLFRQALFTQLFEANVAPTRLSMQSLDNPLAPQVVGGKIVWEPALWSLLGAFGGYLKNVDVEDVEVEAFEEDAILMLTHHRAKGLEFDHVVAAGLGRNPDHGPALRTRLFSGDAVPYVVTETSVETTDAHTVELALADREREAYVALSRAKSSLTLLHDKGDAFAFLAANPTIEGLFANVLATPHATESSVTVRAWS